jgi:hypothetical protein
MAAANIFILRKEGVRVMAIKRKAAVLCAAALGLAIVIPSMCALYAASVGQVMNNVSLRDSSDNPGARIPDFGAKVVAVFYVDPDNSDRNEPLRDALKAANLPVATFRAVGVVNLAESWKPNGIIRTMIRQKERKYGSIVLTDPDRTLKNAWSLGDCDGRDIVIILGKNRQVKYINNGSVRGDEINRVLDLVRAEISK